MSRIVHFIVAVGALVVICGCDAAETRQKEDKPGKANPTSASEKERKAPDLAESSSDVKEAKPGKLSPALVEKKGEVEEKEKAPKQVVVAEKKLKKSPEKLAEILADKAYSIISTRIMTGVYRSLDVRLYRRINKEDLRTLALELKAQDSRKYDRTLILYYLPEMKVGEGAWATTHFNPDLQVKIMGVSAEAEMALAKEPSKPNRHMIGSWLDNNIGLACTIVVYERDGKIRCEETFNDGSRATEELIEKASSSGRRFYRKDISDASKEAGDHWVIDPSGNLQIRDNEGLIRTATKVK